MGKGIIVVDMPETCQDCLLSKNHPFPLQDCKYCIVLTQGVIRAHQTKRPNWCPIRPMPERAHHKDYWDNGRYDKGWNDCLDELLKDGG